MQDTDFITNQGKKVAMKEVAEINLIKKEVLNENCLTPILVHKFCDSHSVESIQCFSGWSP